MDLLASSFNFKHFATVILSPPQPTATTCSYSFRSPPGSAYKFPFPVWAYPFARTPNRSPSSSSITIHARKKISKSDSDPLLKPTIVEEVSMDEDDEEEEQLLFDDFEDDESMIDNDDDYFEEEYIENETEQYVGDGAGGGGISLAGTWWDKEALRLAEDICLSFDGELGIYAFKTLSNSSIKVRIERLTNKSGSPSMEDVEAFSVSYRSKLDEAELAKSVPENITLEVSSPGVERVVRIPQDLERFRDRSMYVKYVTEVAESGSLSEGDGVFRLISFDMETKRCTWGLADVRINREKAGKGRPLSKKQKEWRLETTFDSLQLVKFYSEI
ncbi:Ribosome maturation factor RimP [Corchorus capsularis]|uniref:Ribosome maturation factor RimP n=1 Tax=Corchorus capsularis TaxID=210143 RepID=A0A1R3GKD3_COCAP|nr:Ribosome maturation factor RimP [Corchorus capsularis]